MAKGTGISGAKRTQGGEELSLQEHPIDSKHEKSNNIARERHSERPRNTRGGVDGRLSKSFISGGPGKKSRNGERGRDATSESSEKNPPTIR